MMLTNFRETTLGFEREGLSLQEKYDAVGDYLGNVGFGTDIWVVASGKGGVGKSVTAQNLSHALARAGLKTGLLEIDLFDPNGAGMVYSDTKNITLDVHGNPTFGNGKSMIDVVIGKKVTTKSTKRGKDTKNVHFEKTPLEDIAVSSTTHPNLDYFLSTNLGEDIAGRGSKDARQRELNEGLASILERVRTELSDYHVVVVDSPPFNVYEHLDIFANADNRLYVSDYKDASSFDGTKTFANYVKRRSLKGNSLLVVNKVPQIFREAEFMNFLNSKSYMTPLSWLVDKFSIYGGHKNEAGNAVVNCNGNLSGQNLNFNFVDMPITLYDMEDIRTYENRGMPYLAQLSEEGLERSNVYSRELFDLATYLVQDKINSMRRN